MTGLCQLLEFKKPGLGVSSTYLAVHAFQFIIGTAHNALEFNAQPINSMEPISSWSC